tara:strand:+ start:5345 stop:5620 length:276 start_codon:yes stop_codon:yes gene_type:complete
MTDDLVKRLLDKIEASRIYDDDEELLDEAADRIEKLERENDDTALHLYAFASRIEKLEAALRSIAANACCDSCREAALVARKALEGKDDVD